MEDDGKIKHIGSILERRRKRSPVFVESIRLLPNGLRREVTRFAQRMRRRHDAVDLHVDALQFARYTLFPWHEFHNNYTHTSKRKGRPQIILPGVRHVERFVTYHGVDGELTVLFLEII